jgi:hypothetical protein
VPAFYVAFELQADLAQLVAHRTCNAGVRGSSPLVGPRTTSDYIAINKSVISGATINAGNMLPTAT